MSFGKGFTVSPLTASAIQNFAADVLAIAGGGGSGGGDALTGSTNIFLANQIISGNLDITGILTAKEFHVTQVTSSILYESGSTKFGDDAADTHQFTGSVIVSGNLTASAGTFNYIDLNTSSAGPAFKTGRFHYGASSGDIEYDTDIQDVTLKIGQQTILKVRNSYGSTLAKGTLVRFTGTNNATPPTVTTASWVDEIQSAHTIGMVIKDILAGQNGYIILEGVLPGLNISAGYNAGDLLYLSSSGLFSNSEPPPNTSYHSVRVGQVLKTGGAGALFIKVDNGYEIDELHDTDINSAAHGDLFMRSGSVEGTAQWINTKQLSGDYGVTGSLRIVGLLSASNGITGSFSGNGSQLAGISGLVNTNQVVYVNAGYAGALENGSFLAPYKTIQAAHDYASSSYSNFSTPVLIDIAPGTYAEDLTITRHNTYFRSSTSKYEQRSVKISGQTIIDCLTAAQKYNEIVGFEGVFFQKTGAAVATVEVKGTGRHLTYFKDCYLYNTNGGTGASCLKTANTNTFANNKIVIQNCYFKGEGASGWDGKLLELAGGDIKIDGTEISTSGVSGNGYGIHITGDTIVAADKILVDIDVDQYAIYNASSIVSSTPKIILSNASILTSAVSPLGTIYSSNITLLSSVLLGGSAPKIVGTSPSPLSVVAYTNLTSLTANTPIVFNSITQSPLTETHGVVVASELSGNLSSSYIQGVIPVSKGGTGLTILQTGSLLVGNGTGNVAYLSGSTVDNGKVVTWVSGAFILTGSSAAGLNITPTAEGQTLISSGSNFIAARPIAGSNIGLDFSSGSITVKLSSSLNNLTSVSSSGFTGSFSGSIGSSSMITGFVTDVQNIAAASGIRSLTAGDNIGITAGQNPTVSLSGTINITNAYLLGEIRAKTGSFEVLNNVSASSVQLGDKYIIIASGASDHYNLDEAGILWGSGSIDSTRYSSYSSSAAMVYLSQSDTLYAYPRLSSSFTGAFSGDGSNITNLNSNNIGGVVKTVNATAPLTGSVNGTVLTIALNSGSVSFNGVTASLGASGSIPLVSSITVTGSSDYLTGIYASSSSLSGAVNLALNKTLSGFTSVSSSWFTGSFSGSGVALTNVASSLVYGSANPALAITQVVALSGGLVAATATDRLRANAFGVIVGSSSATGYTVQTNNEARVAFSTNNLSLLVTGSEIYVSSSGTASLYEDITGSAGGRFATQIGYFNRRVGSDYYIIISPRPFGLVY
jgi:hypothetical protein